MFDDNVLPLERIYHGPQMAFLVLGRDLVGSVKPDIPYLVISISDPGWPPPALAESPLRRAVLRRTFHDMSQVADVPGLEGLLLSRHQVAMTIDDARAILSFVESYLEQVELVVCQCEAGISRSAGVAAALSRILQGEDAFFFEHYRPNRLVYDLILRADEDFQGRSNETI